MQLEVDALTVNGKPQQVSMSETSPQLITQNPDSNDTEHSNLRDTSLDHDVRQVKFKPYKQGEGKPFQTAIQLPDRNFVPAKSAPSTTTTPNCLGLPSSAIATIKANMLMKDSDNMKYLKRFTLSPHAALSAKLCKQNTTHMDVPESQRPPKFPSLNVLNPGVCATPSAHKVKSRESLPPMKFTTEFSKVATETLFSDKPDGWPLHQSVIKHAAHDNATARKDSPKKRLDEYAASKKSHANIEGVTLSTSSSSQPASQENNEDGREIRDQLTVAKEEIIMEDNLLSLTDSVCMLPDVKAALDSLISIASRNDVIAKDSIFDHGGVPILLHLMKKFDKELEVQAKAARLLEIMGRANPLTFKALYKQNGFIRVFTALQLMYDKVSCAKPENSEVQISQKEPSVVDPDGATKPVVPNTANSIHPSDAIRDMISSNLTTEAIERAVVQSSRNSQALTRKCCLMLQNLNELLHMTEAVAGVTRNLEKSLYLAAKSAQTILNCEKALIYLVDEFTGGLFAADFDPALSALEKSVICDRKYPLKSGSLAGHCYESKCAINIKENAHNRSNFNLEVDSRGLSSKVDSVLCIPLLSENGTVFGVIECINKLDADKVVAFNVEDEYLMKRVSAQLQFVSAYVNTCEKLRSMEGRYKLAVEAAGILKGSTSLKDLALTIIEKARDLLTADRCSVFLFDAASNELTSTVQFNDAKHKIQIPSNAGIAGHTFTHGEVINISQVHSDPRFHNAIDKDTGYNTRSILSVPLRTPDGRSFGVIQMLNKNIGPFTSDDVTMLEYFASQATAALDKEELISTKNNLTQMLNNTRVHLHQILDTVTNVVITIDKDGIVRNVNHPSLMDASVELPQHFHALFGSDNAKIVADIDRVLVSEEPVDVSNATLMVSNKLRSINYNVTCIKEFNIGSHEIERLVVVRIEDISVTRKAVSTLGRYITPELTERVMSEAGNALELKKMEASVLYINLRQYAALSEKLDSDAYLTWIHHHFTVLANDIASEEGVIDKFDRGTFSVIFGSDSQKDPLRACQCAMRMKRSLESLNEMLNGFGRPEVDLTFGMDMGTVMTAFIGNPERAELVRVGEPISLARRMDQLSQTYNVDMVVTESMFKEVSAYYHLRELDQVVYRTSSVARMEPIKVYAVFGEKKVVQTDATIEAVDLYSKGLTFYRRRQFKTAVEFFQSALGVLPEDGPSKAMLSRCKLYVDQPPPIQDWDGSYAIYM
ncbi:hypothetical protein CcCBS67573_g02995 [Chytriomyces confervae]|uniref:Guanylate cyclase domain-containing protein n=1 Tax=Chytriomyces confervae TaxID=246404 RepID=A0A507FK82_9FUNG|nr:hypothetical protein HDU80_006225 [Chytriomyces hyalinus]TPX75726.1 hypothetical protein CcCBS67573_g02995 [Chytriomyces confervae]